MNEDATNPRVLIVDDDSVVRAILGRIARSIPGLAVDQAATAAEALRLAEAHGPHLVFSDMEMPGETGLWLLEQLRSRGFTAPVVILSGSLGDEDEPALLARGVARVIRKPAEAQAIRHTMIEFLTRPVRFELAAAPGSEVFVAGTFNGWDPRQFALHDNPNEGLFAGTIPLLRGRHEYKFIVDGVWQADPKCAQTVGDTLNSVLIV